MEAAAANAAAAQRQAKLLEVEHGTEKKSLETWEIARHTRIHRKTPENIPRQREHLRAAQHVAFN